MDKNSLTNYYQRLIDTKNQIQKQLETNDKFGLYDAFNDSIGELSSYDNHPADIATEVFERGKDLALKEEALRYIERIDKALNRIREGSYGTCERCDKVINEERLAIVPETALCVTCHQDLDKHEQARHRPIEEEFLASGFGNHNYDESSRETEFDSEDSWQAVAEYGTSNDPSMLGGETNYNEMYTESHETEPHYHIEYNNVYYDKTEIDIDDYYDEQWDEEMTGITTIEQQAYQEYLREKE